MDNKEKKMTRCSFCGKTADMVEKIISGPDANICNECVLLCNEIVFEEMETDRETATTPREMKELLDYMSRHHEDLEKSFSDEQNEVFEKFHDCWSEIGRAHV